jgi:acetylornithine deacetylase
MSTGTTEPLARVLVEVDDLVTTMVDDVCALVRIPSVSGTDAENDAQADMARRFERGSLEVDHWAIDLERVRSAPGYPGEEVDRSEAWGLVGRLPGIGGDGTGADASLMFNGHVDVVPTGDPAAWDVDPFAGRIHRDRIFGRGACDMKGGLLAAHWAIQAIVRSGVRLRGDLCIAPVQGEEDGGLGSFALLERGWRADRCVIPEPTRLDIIPANSGALTFRLRVRGLATHAARRDEGVSAIEKFWPIWRALDELERRRHARVDPLFSHLDLAHPLSIGTISSGDWASSVPDLLVAEGRIGVAIDEDVSVARLALESAVADACASDPWLCDHPVDVEWWGGQFASGRLPADSDLVDRVRSAHRRAGGSPAPDVYGAPYGSDLRLLTGLGEIPTVQYGPGDAKVAHGPHESVAIADIVTTARTLAALALDVCGVA